MVTEPAEGGVGPVPADDGQVGPAGGASSPGPSPSRSSPHTTSVSDGVSVGQTLRQEVSGFSFTLKS